MPIEQLPGLVLELKFSFFKISCVFSFPIPAFGCFRVASRLNGCAVRQVEAGLGLVALAQRSGEVLSLDLTHPRPALRLRKVEAQFSSSQSPSG